MGLRMKKLRNLFTSKKNTDNEETIEWQFYPSELKALVMKKNIYTLLLLLLSFIMFVSSGKNPLIFFTLAAAVINIVLTFTFILDCKSDKINVIEGICADVSSKKLNIKILHASFFERNNILITCEDLTFKIPVKHINAFSKGDVVRVYFYKQEYRPITDSYYTLFNPLIVKIIQTDTI